MDWCDHTLCTGALVLFLGGCGDEAVAGDGFGTGAAMEPAVTTTGGGDTPPPADDGSDDAPPPEMEQEADFRVPRASGRWVYSTSEITNSVAVIDSDTLSIDVVGVGQGPTVVAPLAAEGRVAVLDQGSDDVALLTTLPAQTNVEVVPTSPGANSLAVTPDGEFVVVYHDIDDGDALTAGSDQELTIIAASTGEAFPMTVGAHPRSIAFTADSATAYVITDDGVNVVPLGALATIGKPDLVPVVSDPAINPATLEIQVAPDQGVALARIEGQDEVFATDLATGIQFTLPLDGIATDLDIAADGSFAVVTLPSAAGSEFMTLSLPLSDPPSLTAHAVGSEYVGLAQLSPDGETMILYTTVDPFAADAPPDDRPRHVAGRGAHGGVGGSGTGTGMSTGTDMSTGMSTGTGTGTDTAGDGSETGEPPPLPQGDPRLRVTIARRNAGDWDDLVTLFVDRPVAAVGIAPDGASAMLLHGPATTGTTAPWSYTLVDLTKAFPVKKLQVVAAEPGPVLFTPDGARAVVLLRDDAVGLQRIDRIDLRTFIVQGLTLGSPPEGAGFVDATQKIFVSQEHPTGRITFVDPTGQVQTVTGFRLNDAVKD